MAQGGESGDIDGRYIACGNYNDGIVYLSKDHGNTFDSIHIESEKISEVSISGDGNYIMVVVRNKNYVYVSSDFGSTFVKKIITQDSGFSTYCGSVSNNGRFMIVGAFRLDGKESVAISKDFGETWDCKTINFNDRWYGISISNDGNYIVASANNNIAVSQDGGKTFFNKDTRAAGLNVMSADGEYIVVATSYGPCISRDFGNNFANDSSISKSVGSSDISSSGEQVLCIVTDNILYKSTDYAHVFEKVTLSFAPLKISGSYDFKYIVAMDKSGYIYISNDYGVTFTKTSNQISNIDNVDTLVMNKYIKE